MSIHGSFKTLPLPDLLPMLARRNGVLEINHLAHYGTLHVVFERGIVRRLEHNSVAMDRVQARAALLEAVNDSKGTFRFTADTMFVPRDGDLNWSLEKVLLGLATQADEQAHHDALLPDADIVFQATSFVAPPDEPLWSFWQRAQDWLAQGVSARKLAVQLGIPERQAQFFLYKLRLAGKVSPVRLIDLDTAVKPERQSLASRLLSAIFGKVRT
jgi:hypothetical protein